ncbi:MAG: polysaccharide biosynthesis protein [Anaerolineae bacterium]|nr:polysaccharide biosynthesis protein [Anaerolineae bacterium]NUQ06326.1 polysaccharide biosynthesis protein [Anaerolineae bacterium]
MNVLGTLSVAELAQEMGAERFVLLSSDAAVRPVEVIGASQRLAEVVLHALAENRHRRTRFAVVRFGEVLDGGCVPQVMRRQIAAGGPVLLPRREAAWHLVSVVEAVDLTLRAASMMTGDDMFLLQLGESVRIAALAERLIRLRRLRPYKDIKIIFEDEESREKRHRALLNELEYPQGTPHGSILQVHRWTSNFNPTLFWWQLNQLFTNVPSDYAEVLKVMHHILAPAGQPLASRPEPAEPSGDERTRRHAAVS